MTEGYRVLTVPGWHGSGPDHWQTIWEEEESSTLTRVEQRDWAEPRLSDWLESLEGAVSAHDDPIILVAHSLGSLLVAKWAETSRRQKQVAGALLVAPPWLGETCGYPSNLREFFPKAPKRLPFRSVVVASQDDPYMTFEAAEALGRDWGARMFDAGKSGHINALSGHGPWPEGWRQLQGLIRTSMPPRGQI